MPKTEAKVVLDKELTYLKSTKGTHVLENEDANLTFYVPKPFFEAAGVKPEGRFRIVIESLEK